MCFWQGSMPFFGHIALVFQSLHGTGPQISQRRDFADEIFDMYFSKRWSLFSRVLAWRSVDLVNRTFSNRSNGYFCLGYFFSSTHVDLVRRMAQKGVAALSSGFWARSSLSYQNLHCSPFEHWPFCCHWVTCTFSSFYGIYPFRLLTTAPVSIFSCLASKFRNHSF